MNQEFLLIHSFLLVLVTMIDLILAALPCQPDAYRPFFSTNQRTQVEIYIVGQLAGNGRSVDPEMIDYIMQVEGCLARLEGPQKTIEVIRWEGVDKNNQPRAIEAKWENGLFLRWKGENF